MIISSPTIASQATFATDVSAVALEGINANPKPRISRNGRNQDGQVIAAYPLPNFDSPMTAGVSAPGQQEIVFQPPIIANQPMMASQVPAVETNSAANPMIAGVPPLIPQSDPAHLQEWTPETTASTPVVDPH